jgi:alpha-1,3-rhamnosyl/mannosyltransferase
LFSSLRERGQRWLEGSFRKLCVRQRFELYHEPNYIPLPCDVPAVATIHDLSALLYPQWHPLDRVRHFERRFAEGLKRCVHLLTVSETVRREMLTHLSLRPEQVTAIPLGIRPGFRPLPAEEVERGLRRLRLPPRYLLHLGTLEPRKNVLRLLRVYGSLPAELRSRWPLLLVGGWGWNRGEIAEYLDGEARHKGVLHLGYLADRHLPLLYNGARALVFPSHYEGFGLPPLEMLACGGAVLASKAGALAETVGGQAHLVDAEDADGWRSALVRVLTDDDWHRSLRSGAEEVARPFTWERCAEQTWQVYQQALGRGALRACA